MYYGMHDFYFIPGPPNPIFEALIDIYVVEKPILDSGHTTDAIDFKHAPTEEALRAIINAISCSYPGNRTSQYGNPFSVSLLKKYIAWYRYANSFPVTESYALPVP